MDEKLLSSIPNDNCDGSSNGINLHKAPVPSGNSHHRLERKNLWDKYHSVCQNLEDVTAQYERQLCALSLLKKKVQRVSAENSALKHVYKNLKSQNRLLEEAICNPGDTLKECNGYSLKGENAIEH